MGATKPSFIEQWEADGIMDNKLLAIKLHAKWGTPLHLIAKGIGVTYRTMLRMKQSDLRVKMALEEGNFEYASKLYDNVDTLLIDILTHPDISPTVKYDYFMKHIKRSDVKWRPDLDPASLLKKAAESSSSSPASPSAQPASSSMFTLRQPVSGGDNLGSVD